MRSVCEGEQMNIEIKAILFVMGTIIGWLANDTLHAFQKEQVPVSVECACTCISKPESNPAIEKRPTVEQLDVRPSVIQLLR